VKTAIIALSAAALIAATSAAAGQQHKVFKKHHHQVVYGYAPWRHAHATYPGTFSFAPSGPKDYIIHTKIAEMVAAAVAVEAAEAVAVVAVAVVVAACEPSQEN
jgi:hypothetical protein